MLWIAAQTLEKEIKVEQENNRSAFISHDHKQELLPPLFHERYLKRVWLEAFMLKRLAFIFMFIFVLFAVNIADAHSPIEKRFPEVNAVIEYDPQLVELYFEDPVQIHRSSIVVRNDQLMEVQIGKAQLDPDNDHRIFVPLQRELPSGKYKVEVDVVAMDGHSLNETYTFEIKVVTTSPEEKFKNLKLERSIPEDGTIVQASPKRIEVWYNEAVEMAYFGLLDDKQQLVDTGNPQVDPNDPKHYILELENELPRGTYAIHFYPRIEQQTTVNVVYFAVNELTSITGNQEFSFDKMKKQLGALQFAHWIAYLGLLTLFGGSWFRLILDKQKRGDELHWQQVANILYIISILAIILELFMYRSSYYHVVWKDFINFNFVWITLLQLGIVTLSFAIKKLRFVLLAGAIFCWTLLGHSTDPAYGGFVGIGLDYVHLIASSFWIGGLCALVVQMPKEKGQEWLNLAGAVFSKWALISFIMIGISGIWMSIHYVQSFSFDSLYSSSWGKMLLGKTVLFLIIIVIAIWQRRLLNTFTTSIVNMFKRNLFFEYFIAILIVLAAAFLVDLSPREALQDIYPSTQTQDDLTIDVEAYPLKAGANDITIQLNDETNITKVQAKFYTNLGGLVENTAFYLGNGVYKLTGNYFHGAGAMNMEVTVTKKDGSTVVFPPVTFQIPGYMPTEYEIENEG